MSSSTLSPSPPVARAYADHARSLWQRLLINREAPIVLLLVLVFVWASTSVPNFSGPLTNYFLILDNAPVLLIALPMTMVIITGEIDLSVASVVGLSSVLLGDLHQHGMSIPAAALVALLAGLVCGIINGVLVAYIGLPSLAVTIGTMALFRGIAVGLLGTKAVTDFPTKWTDRAIGVIGSTRWPTITIVLVLLSLIFLVVLQFTSFGRGVYDIGLNDEAARFSGVDVARTKLILFAVTGLVSAFAGIFFTLRFGSARGDNATGMELQVIAAVLLGGVSIFGGRGGLIGVIAGVLLIGVVSSALRLENVTDNVINIIIGGLLVLSVMSSSVLSWVSRTWTKTRKRGGPSAPSPSTGPTSA